jgi:hypothetical protein
MRCLGQEFVPVDPMVPLHGPKEASPLINRYQQTVAYPLDQLDGIVRCVTLGQALALGFESLCLLAGHLGTQGL